MSNEVQRYITGIMTPVEMANPGPASISARQTVVVTYDDYAALEAECERLRGQVQTMSDALDRWPSIRDGLKLKLSAAEQRNISLSAQLEAIRSAGGELVEVVAEVEIIDESEGSGGPLQHYCHLTQYVPDGAQLMTVAQHQRIVAAMAAELERLNRESQNLSDQLGSCDRKRRDAMAELQAIKAQGTAAKLQWPEIVGLVNEVLGCEAHKFPCERGSIGHEMTGINFNSLARIIDRVQHRHALPPLAGKVSVPRELLRRVCWPVVSGSDRHTHSEAVAELRALLATPSMEVKS